MRSTFLSKAAPPSYLEKPGRSIVANLVPSGISHGVMTPMTPEGDVGYPMLEKLVDFHITKGGATSLCLLLNLAEAPSLTQDERVRVVLSAGAAAGRRVPVFVNITTSDFDQQVALSRTGAAIGAAGVVAMPPYCRRLSHKQAEDHFRALARQISLPIILYNSPHTGHGLDPATPAALHREGLPILGLKDASFDAEYAARVSVSMFELDRSFAFMPGIEYLLPITPIGGRAAFGICSLIAPGLIGALEQAVAERRWNEAASLQGTVSALLQLLLQAYPASAKAAAAAMGRSIGGPRDPHLGLDARSSSKLERELAALGILDGESFGW